ncbi:MAG: tetratricopeptide repeat protein [Thermonemataceae bacterium]
MKRSQIKKIQSLLYVIILLSFGSLQTIQAQSIKLAEEYFLQGEYEKAKDIYQQYTNKKENIKKIYDKYLLTLINLKDFDTAEKFLEKLVKQEQDNPKYAVALGYVHRLQGKDKVVEKEYKGIVNKYKKITPKVLIAFDAFVKYEAVDWAEKLLLEARREEGEKTAYAPYLAELYLRKNEKEKMIGEYLNMVLVDYDHMGYVQGALQDALQGEEDLKLLESTLIQKVQESPNEKAYGDLIMWLYIQEKNFYKAYIQAKAMDKRFKLNGFKVLELGFICYENEDYKSASRCFEYVIQQYPQGSNFVTARIYLIKSKEEVIKNTFPIDQQQVRVIIGQYKVLLSQLGKSVKTLEAMNNMGILYAFYLNEKDSALAVLNEAIDLGKYNTRFVATSKISLGDVYLLKGEPWEATLLYSQAEKMVKDSPTAHEAKLKNAKLHYYKGDFELALAQLDILKMATSREIANDAMDLALLIQDNIGLDSTGAAMRAYANTELLLFQNRNEEAMQQLNDILKEYPQHSITDEIYWLKGQIYVKQGDLTKALEMLEKIINDFNYDIYSDDAHFLAASLYERLDEKDKAMEMYREHLQKYPGSIFIAEARKRFRRLRGDFPN